MAKRGLHDWEIALVKRMTVEGYARDKMHAYFNRPERTLPPITNDRDLRRVMQAVRMVASADRAQMEILWKALESGYEFAWAAKNGGDLQSYVKSAAARLDELSEAQEAVTGRAASQLSDD